MQHRRNTRTLPEFSSHFARDTLNSPVDGALTRAATSAGVPIRFIGMRGMENSAARHATHVSRHLHCLLSLLQSKLVYLPPSIYPEQAANGNQEEDERDADRDCDSVDDTTGTITCMLSRQIYLQHIGTWRHNIRPNAPAAQLHL